MSSTIKIPNELGDILTKISLKENKEKSYYIRIALENFLKEKLENMSDYKEGFDAYLKFKDSNQETFSLEETFKHI